MAKKSFQFKWYYLIVLVIAAFIIYKLAGGQMFSSYDISTQSTCYQEQANEASLCGGLATGSYVSVGTFYASPYDVTKLYDSSWTTRTFPAMLQSRVYLYVNYSKPTGADSESLWQVKDSIGKINLTIPTNCWNNDATNLQLKVESYSQGTVGVSYASWNCYNGATWQNLRNTSGSTQTYSELYEESMYWNIVTVTTVTNTSNETVETTTNTSNETVVVSNQDEVETTTSTETESSVEEVVLTSGTVTSPNNEIVTVTSVSTPKKTILETILGNKVYLAIGIAGIAIIGYLVYTNLFKGKRR